VSIKNLSDLMFAYTAIAPMAVNDKRQFLYDIENAAYKKVVMKDKFNTVNSTKMLWGYSKFINRHLNPYFNSDVASCILNRFSLS
jgi:hypothetical protein